MKRLHRNLLVAGLVTAGTGLAVIIASVIFMHLPALAFHALVTNNHKIIALLMPTVLVEGLGIALVGTGMVLVAASVILLAVQPGPSRK